LHDTFIGSLFFLIISEQFVYKRKEPKTLINFTRDVPGFTRSHAGNKYGFKVITIHFKWFFFFPVSKGKFSIRPSTYLHKQGCKA